MRKLAVGAAATAALALIASTPASPAMAAGNRSLAAVLTSDGNHFDSNWKDYDIVTEAVLAVLKAKPDSAVKILADGNAPATAFVPNDRAFKYLVKSLTGKSPKTERATFAAVAGLGIPTVETVLLYHVVPDATITAKQARKANGVKLTTAQGGTIKVQVRGKGSHTIIKLSDKDYDSRNPRVVVPDINKGNKQIAHGIDRVLRPVDL
ncbi:MAG: fasciclin domain-containing protein [Candidatus Nanopelagicales bacterium]